MPAANSNSPTGATNDGSSSGQVGFGFSAKNQHQQQRPTHQPPRATNQPPNRRGGFKIDKSKLWCSHCGKNKHTRETCFLLVGFPEWWDENQKAKARLAIGVEDGGGGGLFLQGAGNQEATNTRGRTTDVVPQQGGGGRTGEVAGIGGAAFAEKRGGGGSVGGNGLGLLNPNPQSYLQIDPLILPDAENKPHCLGYLDSSPYKSKHVQISPQNTKKQNSAPEFHEKSYLSPNHFAPLEHISIACIAQSKTNPKESGWIFDCGATDTMSYDRSDFTEL